MTEEDWADIAARASRDQFVQLCPHPFLLALSGTDAHGQMHKKTMRLPDARDVAAAVMAERRRMAQQSGRAVLAIKKRQPSFPHMITLGRAATNDIVIQDAVISKFHAWFRVDGNNVAMADAGSANGTRVNDVLLVHNAEPTPLKPGDKVVFGVLAFRFVDAAGAWAALRR